MRSRHPWELGYDEDDDNEDDDEEFDDEADEDEDDEEEEVWQVGRYGTSRS